MIKDVRATVIVPMYNSEEHVAECITSVLRQTMRDFELICVDDGSVDATCSIVEEFAQRDNRIRILCQENAGPGVARNAALESARGEYVYCLDSDDFLERDMLARCLKILGETCADMAIFAFRTYNQQVRKIFPAEWSMRNEEVYPVYPQGTFTWETAPNLFFETVQNIPWNKMVRRELLDSQGIRFQSLHLTEDMMYSLPAAVASRSIVRISRPLAVHREFAGTNAMADKGRYPLDFLHAFEALQEWLRSRGTYEPLRQAYQTWLLDAVYYNLPTYRDFKGFKTAFDRLSSDSFRLFDLADLDLALIRDERYRELLEALNTHSMERFLLGCSNIEAAEVQQQKCGFQSQQTSLKWLAQRLRDRLRHRWDHDVHS